MYVALEIERDCECPSNSEQSQRYLEAVGRAAELCEKAALRFDGLVLEVQGSVIHVGLPQDNNYPQQAELYTATLHTAYLNRFDLVRGAVKAWRMTVDIGMTLIISGEGVHGDRSLISLADAANRPAKHLYSQLLERV